MPKHSKGTKRGKAFSASKSLTEAGEALGVTRQAIGHWASRPGAPMTSESGERRCKWPEFPRWRERQLLAGARPAADLKSAKTRLDTAKAEREELALAREKAELMTAEQFQESLTAALQRVDVLMRGLPGRLAGELVGLKTRGEMAKALEAEIERIRAELYKADDIPDDGEDPKRA